MKTYFSPSDIEDSFWEEIRWGEKLLIIIANIKNLFSILNNVAEVSKLHIKRNLLPEYQCHIELQDVDSIWKLKTLLRKFEQAEIDKNKTSVQQIFQFKEYNSSSLRYKNRTSVKNNTQQGQ